MRAPLSLRARAVALLAQREHSEQELRRKLQRIARDIARNAAAQAAAPGDAASDEPPAGRRARRDFEGSFDAPSAPAFDPPADVEVDAEAVAAAASEEVEAVLVWVRSQGYLDESRFVESRLHARTARWGQRRIEQELAQHGLSLDADQRAQLSETELDRACELLRRKFSSAAAMDPAQEPKQMRFLLGRGFGSEVSRRAIRQVRALMAGEE